MVFFQVSKSTCEAHGSKISDLFDRAYSCEEGKGKSSLYEYYSTILNMKSLLLYLHILCNIICYTIKSVAVCSQKYRITYVLLSCDSEMFQRTLLEMKVRCVQLCKWRFVQIQSQHAY